MPTGEQWEPCKLGRGQDGDPALFFAKTNGCGYGDMTFLVPERDANAPPRDAPRARPDPSQTQTDAEPMPYPCLAQA